MARRTLLAVLLGILAVIPSPALAQDASWRLVDGLRPGSRIVVTVVTGERHSGRFQASTSTDVVLHDATLQKSRITSVRTEDRLRDGVQWGALAGGAAVFAGGAAGLAACRQGCESGEGGLHALGGGALIGSGVGLLVDLLNGRDEVLYPPGEAGGSSFVPRKRVTARIGPTVGYFAQPSFAAASPARGASVAVEVARYLTLHVEYTYIGQTFSAPAGAVPDSVVQNVVPAAGRIAGLRRGIESQHISWVFSELVGVPLPAIGRVRLEVLAGAAIQASGERAYYDAYERTGTGNATIYRRLPGQYSVLNFEAPDYGWQFGMDGDIAVSRHIAVVPSVRYHRLRSPGPTIIVNTGVQWRF